MYEELVARLRDRARREDEYYDHAGDVINEAADAIEEEDMAFRHLEQDYKELCAHLPKWIPVTERLPDGQYPVLVYVPPYTDTEEEFSGYVGVAYYTSSAQGGFWCGTDGNVYGAIGIIREPLAWMPLPEPPKWDEKTTCGFLTVKQKDEDERQCPHYSGSHSCYWCAFKESNCPKNRWKQRAEPPKEEA